MTEPTREAERVVDEYVAVWNERDYSKIPEIVTESFARVSPVADDVRGPDGLEEFVRALEAGFSDFRIVRHDALVGEDVVMSEDTFAGTHDGEFDGIPPTEREVEVRTMSKTRIEDGKIDEHRTYYDRAELLGQLGVEDA